MQTPHRTPYRHITRIRTAKDSSGQFRTIDQLLRSTLKLREYGQYLATQQRGN
jgi:hypothetical protein